MVFTKRGCCLRFPFLGSSSERSSATGSIWWERIRTVEKDERWWNGGLTTALKKFREWSEMVAGSRWKTFIRRFNRNRGGGTSDVGKFHYDPLSYALNFDENGVLDEDVGYRNFSARYASIPASAKSSMDLGEDGPTFAA